MLSSNSLALLVDLQTGNGLGRLLDALPRGWQPDEIVLVAGGIHRRACQRALCQSDLVGHDMARRELGLLVEDGGDLAERVSLLGGCVERPPSAGA